MDKLKVLEYEINTKIINQEDYVSLTDIAKKVNEDEPRFVIQNWMRNKDTIDYLGLWESIYNPNFNRVGFEAVENEAGRNRFTMSPTKWINSVNSIGMVTKAGKHGGGTYAHFDIAMEFASWISPEFKLYIVTEFKRMKEKEQKGFGWNLKRTLSKINLKMNRASTEKEQIFRFTANTLNTRYWNAVHPIDLYRATYAKFKQNQFLKENLLKTNGQLLIQCDGIPNGYGCGYFITKRGIDNRGWRFPNSWQGKNLYGFIFILFSIQKYRFVGRCRL